MHVRAKTSSQQLKIVYEGGLQPQLTKSLPQPVRPLAVVVIPFVPMVVAKVCLNWLTPFGIVKEPTVRQMLLELNQFFIEIVSLTLEWSQNALPWTF